ncbi:hypothetical protein RSPO_c00327 [Ralstonia solanacearum Po82]|uniref:Uncharacterized protein n=1 Tax=Ralstonia solanacearum (strain Po82) TaxID=1031711 RepID=F6G6T6_RALS8|nr:hypothetical protein RSPO_c00327 [Ralstonia solanacearum Po82]
MRRDRAIALSAGKACPARSEGAFLKPAMHAAGEQDPQRRESRPPAPKAERASHADQALNVIQGPSRTALRMSPASSCA